MELYGVQWTCAGSVFTEWFTSSSFVDMIITTAQNATPGLCQWLEKGC